MRFGVRRPSLKGRIAARTSWKRYARHSLGFKAPRGMGWFTNPKKAFYNRVYNRTTVSVDSLLSGPPKRRKSAPVVTPAGNDNGSPARPMNVPGLVTLGLLALAPTMALLWFGASLKWAIGVPVALVILAVFGEYIALALQILAGLIGLIVPCFIIYLFMKIFVIG